MTYNEYYEKNINPKHKSEIENGRKKLDRRMIRRQAVKGIGKNMKMLFESFVKNDKKIL
ncbi:MAG: hypothetical protein LBL93_00205 [Ruminococcus sp.]|jgi:hypothetical protein|nr:hypothetical protein [Ruminococcus sp.]